MRLYSWNVNGFRAAVAKGLLDWLQTASPDVLCLQETRAEPDELPVDTVHPPGYQSHWAIGGRKGYSGVATFSRQPAVSWCPLVSADAFDAEGRVVATTIGDIELYNVYFPNGKGSPERLAYKLRFYSAFLELVDERTRAGRSVIFCGDVNTAHTAADLARPRENEKISGFLPEERAWLDRWVTRGWCDSFRCLYPNARGAYTWWTARVGARARNIGWRLDYFFVHESVVPRIVDAGICPEVAGSDHCPVWLELRD